MKRELAIAGILLLAATPLIARNLATLRVLRHASELTPLSNEEAWLPCAARGAVVSGPIAASLPIAVAARQDCADDRGYAADHEVAALWQGVADERRGRHEAALAVWRAHDVARYFEAIALRDAPPPRALTLRFTRYLMELSPADWVVHYRCGQQLRSIDPAAALQALDAATRLAPSEPGPLLVRGSIHLQRGDFAGALNAFQGAAALAPTSVDAWHGAGESAFYLERWGAAIEAFDRERRLGHAGPATSFWLGRSYLYAGRLEQARQWLESAAASAETPEFRTRVRDELARLDRQP